MIRVLITLPHAYDDEVSILEEQAENFDKIHLRKRDWTESETSAFLDQCSIPLLNRLVLCDHYHLTFQFDLGGIHLKEMKRHMNNRIFSSGTVSASFHELATLQREGSQFDYALFGPVYPSFSKKDYKPSYTSDEMHDALIQSDVRAIGIGGVS